MRGFKEREKMLMSKEREAEKAFAGVSHYGLSS